MSLTQKGAQMEHNNPYTNESKDSETNENKLNINPPTYRNKIIVSISRFFAAALIVIGLNIITSGQGEAEKSMQNLTSVNFRHQDDLTQRMYEQAEKKRIVSKQTNSIAWGGGLIFVGIRILFSSFSNKDSKND